MCVCHFVEYLQRDLIYVQNNRRMVFSMYRTTDRFPPLSLSFFFPLIFFLQKLLIEDRLDVL